MHPEEGEEDKPHKRTRKAAARAKKPKAKKAKDADADLNDDEMEDLRSLGYVE